MSRDFFCAHPAPDLISGSSRLPWSHFRSRDVISGSSRGCHGNVTSFPVLASIPRSAELSGPVTKNRPPGQTGHVGQIRLSDWLKFEILASDWSGLKPTPFTTSDITNASSFSGKILRKKSMLENFRANVLKESLRYS